MANAAAPPETKMTDLLDIASAIVTAYVSGNPVPAGDLSAVIRSVHSTLCGLGNGNASELGAGQKPAVPIKKSISPDYIVCLEDGKKLKILKRYLRSNYELSPEQYRAKWGLPYDYPMVAPNYAAKRSDLAKKIGLGHSKPTGRSKRKKRA